MNELKKSIHDNANGLDYTLVNDHYLPNLTAAAPAEQHPTGRWGRLHKMYLKEQRPIQYNQLLLSGELGGYLAKLDKQVEEQLALTVRQMQEAEGVTEALKAADQLEWVRRISVLRSSRFPLSGCRPLRPQERADEWSRLKHRLQPPLQG